MSLIKGRELKERYGEIFYKIINEDMTHNNFVYQCGKNIDTKKFNPKDEDQEGGLYFTTIDNLSLYTDYGTKVGIINIDNDEDVWCETNKFKVHTLLLVKIIPFDEFINSRNDDEIIKYVYWNYRVLKYVKIRTLDDDNGMSLDVFEDICKSIVGRDGLQLVA